ncbi:MAG: hypothetical protein K1X72_16105 [Pyrinomonadaceae bacterium]|nr:hypothetical protein [Pyrinomonadaceae bacterium]
MKNYFAVCFIIIVILSSFIIIKADDKLSVEEILTKHLDSIGTADKRKLITNQLAIGVSEFSILRNSGSKTFGNAVIVSQAGKVMLGTKYNSLDYPSEKVSFDGNKVEIAFITPGLRSPFGNFIFSNKQVFSEGLFGGTLSSSWALFDIQSRNAKLNSNGKKKLDGREVYVLEYSPRRGSSSTIKLYFDAQNFQHLRTEYRQTFSAAQGKTPEQSSQQLESKQILTEDFSDYKVENGLTLPHKYRIHLLLDGRGTNEFEWKFEFSNFLFNQNLEANSFDVNAE